MLLVLTLLTISSLCAQGTAQDAGPVNDALQVAQSDDGSDANYADVALGMNRETRLEEILHVLPAVHSGRSY